MVVNITEISNNLVKFILRRFDVGITLLHILLFLRDTSNTEHI